MANGNGNGNGNGGLMGKLLLALGIAFALGGVSINARVEGEAARVRSIEERLDRRDKADAEFRADIKSGLMEIRNKLDRALEGKGGGK